MKTNLNTINMNNLIPFRNMKNLLWLSAGLFLLSSCDPDEPEPVLGAYANGVFVVNEGTFGVGNASITHLGRTTGTVIQDVYTTVNSVPLGDVAQSMTLIGDKGYIVVNNSGKIEVVTWRDMVHVATITGLTSPRFILDLGNDKAYVTDYSNANISIVDLATNGIVGSIEAGGWTEEMILLNGNAYVCATATGKVLKIDINTNAILAESNIGNQPTSLSIDANGKLWVAINDEYPADEASRIVRINPSNMTTEMTYTFPTLFDYPNDLATSPDGQSIYFLNGQTYRMGIADASLPSTALVDLGSVFPYSLDVDPNNGNLFIGDGGDFTSNGTVHIHNAQGQAVTSIATGIVPGGYAFTPVE